MSSYLWKAYYENDVLAFRHHLWAAAYTRANAARGGSIGPVIGSPGHAVSSPTITPKPRKSAGPSTPASGGHGSILTKAELNARDSTGQTILHQAASSTTENAIEFAVMLIEHPLTDLYVQDYENGWTALHRAFYFGNVSIARLILERDAGDALGRTTGLVNQSIGLIKVKDREGLGPLDLYAATIKDRTLRPDDSSRVRAGSNGSDEEHAGADDDNANAKVHISFENVNSDQLFMFGSNQNVSLGFGDADDRQFPERISLRRPEHLVRRFFVEHLEQQDRKWTAHDSTARTLPGSVNDMWIEDIPWQPKSRPLIIQDVQMSKLHSAVITSDPESNLYICGHGQGGRLGTGDEQTRFYFTCIENGALTGKRVVTVALALNHSLALSDEGEIFSWGNNAYGQLGYSLPKTTLSDEDPISTIPRQIFGPLKREIVVGIAASRIHSVAHTGSSLFTFGKNEGQLGIVDSDARSLEMQTIPRKVAASLFGSTIIAVSAMDKATVCLLESHEVWVFANYGYAKVQFPLEGFTNYFLKQSFLLTTYDHKPNSIVKVTCGGDTICALSTRGEIYTLSINQKVDSQASASTTNPSKIRNAITQPQRIWSPKKNSMAARDVGVDADGSIVLSTEEGSVWKRTKRVKIKDTMAVIASDYKPKDYKFSRVPGLTRVLAVRASANGAYAALRRDCDVTRTQIEVDEPTLWRDVASLLSMGRSTMKYAIDDEMDDDTRHRFWQGHRKLDQIQVLKRALLESKDIEADLENLEERCFADASANFDAVVCTTTSSIRIPVHRFALTGRSRVLRRGFRDLCETSTFTIQDLAISEIDKNGRAIVTFQGLDILTVIDLVIYLYTDNFVDFWHLTRSAPSMAYRYRQVRTELMKIAGKLELAKLEPAARQMVSPKPCLHMDLELAFQDPAFFYDGNVVIQLEDDEIRVHSALLRARCPFFEGLFMGRSGGRWVSGRDDDDEISVDLSHVSLKTFNLVLRHIYADTGTELFDEIVSIGLDDFLDSVTDVLSVANELMLDRLSQICQQVIGRFVNVRNVCGLLNAISPSSVHEFKDAALEYICLSLEAMLQGHYLNELDEDLLLELDEVVRENQLNCMRYSRNGRGEQLLHDRHPDLVDAIERNRQRKIDALALRAKYAGIEPFNDTELSSSPTQQKARRKSSSMAKPSLPVSSSREMLPAVDDEFDFTSQSPSPFAVPSRPIRDENTSQARSTATPPKTPLLAGTTPPNASQPWKMTPLSAPKADMKDIMAQDASSRKSLLTQGLAMGTGLASNASTAGLSTPKMSQKERKRLQHNQQSETAESPTQSRREPSPKPSGQAWQTVSGQKTTTLKDILVAEGAQNPSSSLKPSNARATSTPQLTMRQTVANPKPDKETLNSTINTRGQGAVQSRSVSESKPFVPGSPEHGRSWQMSQPSSSRPIPQSIRHQPPVEPILGLSMSQIVAQQQLEKDVVKEAVAKRDLQDIQAEQEFEEWWNRESARVQEAEKRSISGSSKGPKKSRGPRSSRGKKSGKEKGDQNGTT